VVIIESHELIIKSIPSLKNMKQQKKTLLANNENK
jgi:hypothetical protein